MKKIVYNIFPLADHLYIFQSLEYQSWNFLKWFITHPFKRHLQRKHILDLTPKALLLLILSTVLITVASVISVSRLSLPYHQFLIPFFILFHLQFSPLFLILAQIIINPIESYQKQKLVAAASGKLDCLPNLKVVAVVGSFGKTSIKNMLYTLLWKKFRVVKTPKSFNTELSIAKTILSDLKENSEVFLVEMDAYHPSEIAKLCQLVKPNLGIITAIAAQHLERFGSMEKLASTQFELANHLSQNGILFLNSNDEWSMKMLKQDATYQVKNLSNDIEIFGFEKDDDLFASEIKQKAQELEFNLNKSGGQVKICLPLFGEHHIINFVAASAIALSLGLTLEEIQQRAKWILPTPHRLEITQQGSLTIIDNSYNTNPTVARSSLEILAKTPGSQKILITPGLIELGQESANLNQEFAQDAAKVADLIIVVGKQAKEDLLTGLKKARFPDNKQLVVKDFKQAMEILTTLAKPNAVVLLENDLPDQYF